jgi:hypothetical protein
MMIDCNSGRHVDALPNDFSSEDEAAEFWDTHSISDYEEFLEPVDVQVDIKRRHFEIEVDEESFMALRDSAKRQHKPVTQLASEILKQKLATRAKRASRRKFKEALAQVPDVEGG